MPQLIPSEVEELDLELPAGLAAAHEVVQASPRPLQSGEIQFTQVRMPRREHRIERACTDSERSDLPGDSRRLEVFEGLKAEFDDLITWKDFEKVAHWNRSWQSQSQTHVAALHHLVEVIAVDVDELPFAEGHAIRVPAEIPQHSDEKRQLPHLDATFHRCLVDNVASPISDSIHPVV
jgi:hypothetical protein